MRTGAALLCVLLAVGLVGADRFYDTLRLGGAESPDHRLQVTCDLPVSQRIKNIGSHLDGAGMCVFSSCEMAMRWSNIESYRGWRDWCAEKYPGGGYPEKVDQLVAAYAKAKNIEPPQYVQYEGMDTSILEAAMKTSRMVGVTYNGHDPHYSGTIAHMICLVYFDRGTDTAIVLDNNFIGDNELVWMTCNEFIQRWTGGKSGWAVVFLSPPPPPPPHN